MKKNFTKKLLGLALSVFSITSAVAQCPTITSMSVTLGVNGTATISPVLSGTVSPSQTMYYWSVTPSATQTSGMFQSNGTFQFPANGSYSLLVSINDSLSGCSTSGSTTVTISNMAATSCNASFYFYTDSSCVTHFMNTSTGSNLTYDWYINGSYYTSTNPSVSLMNGSYNAVLYTSSAGTLCDSTSQYISISCGGGGTNTPCQASFYTYTDSLCVTHFWNNSITYGGNNSSQWIINGILYTTPDVSLSLPNGYYSASLYNFSSGILCDSTSQMINVACGSGTTTTGCQANAQFSIFPDSLNTGNFYASNNSSASGNVTYEWNFGDGTPTSTQQYPFHQYATPGSYIICLTVNGTSSTSSCTSTHCDSSSTQKMASGFLMSQIQVVPSTATSIKQVETNIGLKAFPNPITDELIIEATTSGNTNLNYLLVDAIGRTVLTGNLNNFKATINTSSLEKGFYSLSITNEKGSSLKTIKLVK